MTFSAPTHEISPYIFGINWGPTSSVKDLGVSVRRWGGNRATKYNWKDDLDSAGSDWFYLNEYSKPPGTPEDKKTYFQFIKETLAGGAEVNFSIPITEWIAKRHPDEKGRYYVTTELGIQVFDMTGRHSGTIAPPYPGAKIVSCEFAGKDHD